MFFETSCSGDVREAPQYLLSISSKVSSSWPETALIFNFSLMISSSSSSILCGSIIRMTLMIVLMVVRLVAMVILSILDVITLLEVIRIQNHKLIVS